MGRDSVEGTSVSEIHAYPLRPPGFEEPLFPTADARRALAEHLLGAPWLARASELEGRVRASGDGGGTARALREPVEVRRLRGRLEIVRPRGGPRGGRGCARRRRVLAVLRLLDCWREVGGWWDEGRAADRTVFRVLLDGPRGGAVMDLTRERGVREGWFLVGVMD